MLGVSAAIWSYAIGTVAYAALLTQMMLARRASPKGMLLVVAVGLSVGWEGTGWIYAFDPQPYWWQAHRVLDALRIGAWLAFVGSLLLSTGKRDGAGRWPAWAMAVALFAVAGLGTALVPDVSPLADAPACRAAQDLYFADWLLARTPTGGAALLPGAALACRPAPGLDLTVPEYEVEIAGARAIAALDAGAWAALAEDAMPLRAALILGAAEHCLDLAVSHVANRRQFGRALAAFQAMRHLLARQKLAVESIRGALARAVEAGAPPVTWQAAFLAAATLGPQVAEAAIQAHGGMGFTWDIPLHRYLRRIRGLEAQGEAAGLREAVAAALIEGN